jgi:hypothetical protein
MAKTCPLIPAPLLLCPLCEKSYNHIEAEKIRELFTQGLNKQQIAERLDIGRASVFRALT